MPVSFSLLGLRQDLSVKTDTDAQIQSPLADVRVCNLPIHDVAQRGVEHEVVARLEDHANGRRVKIGTYSFRNIPALIRLAENSGAIFHIGLIFVLFFIVIGIVLLALSG